MSSLIDPRRLLTDFLASQSGLVNMVSDYDADGLSAAVLGRGCRVRPGTRPGGGGCQLGALETDIHTPTSAVAKTIDPNIAGFPLCQWGLSDGGWRVLSLIRQYSFYEILNHHLAHNRNPRRRSVLTLRPQSRRPLFWKQTNRITEREPHFSSRGEHSTEL